MLLVVGANIEGDMAVLFNCQTHSLFRHLCICNCILEFLNGCFSFDTGTVNTELEDFVKTLSD